MTTAAASDDYYALLRVEPFASHEAVKRAARRRRAEVHPDRCRAGDEAAAVAALALAQAVNAAADVLTDPRARQNYDDQRAGDASDPFATFAFAGQRCAWFDPRDMGGVEAPAWGDLFACSAAAPEELPGLRGVALPGSMPDN